MPGIKFIPKELRQIEHFLDREEGDEFYYGINGCPDDYCCPDESQSLVFDDEPTDETREKLEVLAKKYNLHIDIDGKYINAAEKGVNDGNRG